MNHSNQLCIILGFSLLAVAGCDGFWKGSLFNNNRITISAEQAKSIAANEVRKREGWTHPVVESDITQGKDGFLIEVFETPEMEGGGVLVSVTIDGIVNFYDPISE